MDGRRRAMYGLLAATVAAALVAVAVVVAVITGGLSRGGTSVLELEVGDCFDVDLTARDPDLETVELVDCAEPHNAEVVVVGRLNPDRDRDYPPDAELFSEIDDRCRSQRPEGFGVLPIAPNAESWVPFDGRFSCIAIPLGGDPVTGSLAAG